MIGLISIQNPFKHHPERSFQSFPSISKSPLDQLGTNKKRLAANPYSCDDSGCDEVDQSGEEEEEEAFLFDED